LKRSRRCGCWWPGVRALIGGRFLEKKALSLKQRARNNNVKRGTERTKKITLHYKFVF
jgi:hypothetical protein